MARKAKAGARKPPAAAELDKLPAEVEHIDPATALENYNAVADRSRLSDVRLTKLEFSVSPGARSSEEASSSRVEGEGGLYYDISVAFLNSDIESGFAAAIFECEVESTLELHSYFSCKATYFVIYDGLEGCDAEAAKVFVGRVGRFACYPYFRTLVATLDWASGARLPPLPVLRDKPPGARGKP